MFMAKITDLMHETFSGQFAPLAEEVSIGKNVLRRMEDEQDRLAAEIRAVG